MLRRRQKINKSAVIKFGFLGGISQAGYCLLVALTISGLEKIMPKPSDPVTGPLVVLLLFVFSAAVSGILVFGYPAYLGLQKRYAEAIMTAVVTLAAIAFIGVAVFILIFLVQLG